MFIAFPSRDFFGAASIVALLCLGGLLSSPAKVATVGISDAAGDLKFFPAVTNISTGDQVVWVWNNTVHAHSTTDTNFWDSGLQQTSLFMFTNTFNSTGTFQYLCKSHFTFGMTGAVIVASASLPPMIAITNPPAGKIFAAPASVTIQAAATNGSGTVTNVQFLVGVTFLTNETTAPFSATTNNLAAGSYTLSVVATDNNTLKATNSVNIVVAPPPSVTITNPASGAVFAAPADVTVQATVSNGGGSVTNVQFLVGSGVLTNKTAPPYSATTNNLVANSYMLSAVATDNNGLKATNTATISVVTPVTVTIGAPARPSPTNFHLSYTANVGLRYIVQRSTNLLATNWLTIGTNTAASSPVNFADTNATTNPGFYRVGRLPNP